MLQRVVWGKIGKLVYTGTILSAAVVVFAIASNIPFRLIISLLIVAIFLIAIVYRSTPQRLIQALGEIRSDKGVLANGKVFWSGKSYTLEVESGKYESLIGEFAPGNYHFTLLPKSRFIVGASALDAATGRDEMNRTLAENFNFTNEDLAMYRNGKIPSHHQTRLMQAHDWTNADTIKTIFSGIVNVLLIFGMIVFVQVSMKAEYAKNWLIFLGIGSLLLIFIFSRIVRFIKNLRRPFYIKSAIRNHQIEVTEGKITKQHKTIGDSNIDYYACKIHNHSFSIGNEARFNALVDTIPYRIYSLAKTEIILAIESI